MRRGDFKYAIPMSLLFPRSGSTWSIAAVLDMMRYDNARVVEWSSDYENGELVLVSPTFTKARWQSFGITPRLISDMVGV